jgi:hypothetical protein
MQRLEVSGAARPLKWPLGVKWLKLLHQFRTWEQKLRTGSVVQAASNVAAILPISIETQAFTSHFISLATSEIHVRNKAHKCQHVLPTVYITKYKKSGHPNSNRA